jgi:hypothetical protein
VQEIISATHYLRLWQTIKSSFKAALELGLEDCVCASLSSSEMNASLLRTRSILKLRERLIFPKFFSRAPFRNTMISHHVVAEARNSSQ